MYNGVCVDPEMFGALLKLGGPPTFKTKNIPKDEFKDLMDDLADFIPYVFVTCIERGDSLSLYPGTTSWRLHPMQAWRQ